MDVDLEFANEALTGEGEAVVASWPKALRKQARVEAAEAFRKASTPERPKDRLLFIVT